MHCLLSTLPVVVTVGFVAQFEIGTVIEMIEAGSLDYCCSSGCGFCCQTRRLHKKRIRSASYSTTTKAIPHTHRNHVLAWLDQVRRNRVITHGTPGSGVFLANTSHAHPIEVGLIEVINRAQRQLQV